MAKKLQRLLKKWQSRAILIVQRWQRQDRSENLVRMSFEYSSDEVAKVFPGVKVTKGKAQETFEGLEHLKKELEDIASKPLKILNFGGSVLDVIGYIVEGNSVTIVNIIDEQILKKACIEAVGKIYPTEINGKILELLESNLTIVKSIENVKDVEFDMFVSTNVFHLMTEKETQETLNKVNNLLADGASIVIDVDHTDEKPLWETLTNRKSCYDDERIKTLSPAGWSLKNQ